MFAFQFSGRIHFTSFFLECTKAVTKRHSDLRQKSQGSVRVHVELSKAMPVSQIKQNSESVSVMGLRQKAIKNRYGTLNARLVVD